MNKVAIKNYEKHLMKLDKPIKRQNEIRRVHAPKTQGTNLILYKEYFKFVT